MASNELELIQLINELEGHAEFASIRARARNELLEVEEEAKKELDEEAKKVADEKAKKQAEAQQEAQKRAEEEAKEAAKAPQNYDRSTVGSGRPTTNPNPAGFHQSQAYPPTAEVRPAPKTDKDKNEAEKKSEAQKK